MSTFIDQATLDLINEMPVFKQIENIDTNIKQLLELQSESIELETKQQEQLETQFQTFSIQSLEEQTTEEPPVEETTLVEEPPEPTPSELYLEQILIELQTKNETDALILEKLEILEESATVSQETDVALYWYLWLIVPLIIVLSFFRSFMSSYLR